ncbi:glycogen debranching protein [Desulfonema ishimotonii]|uniref:Glycogen debranching protein n=1 Tax=Desulfonema ishimotonii TaxID=45657 RepID=A0A401FTK4_9BACT|nr:amylo-alpha-1,6-glucosidase [Desulfonema ishimotonii]GBC60302.1 glycogen debranching protein [Desulfonema ishimotonii]
MRLRIDQQPAPGERRLLFRGDTLTFTVSLSEEAEGRAWLRTGIGHARIAREEIIRDVRHNESPLGRNWFDIPMTPAGKRRYQVTLPLCEVGHFEAKACFLPKNRPDPLWPEGPDTVINVAPADSCCANIIYNAFVRQFGPGKSGAATLTPSEAECIRSLDHSGYTVIPKSGTFRDLIRELDFIIGDLGCRFIQLLPVHPTPTTYARMGRFGSPYAALSFTDVDPALAEFDPKATPLEQFTELVDAVHARQAKVLMDIAINHTGWAANLHEAHPQWLSRDEEGRIEMPGAWGVVWADLTKLDYRHRDLWQYMAGVFLTWCRRGVDGFRCDAGYMIPIPAWTYIVATVRAQYPDTVFLLEGLGGKISVTRDLLSRASLDWAYSELFQNYDRGQIEHYLPEALDIAASDGVMIHFAETHDNNRLASVSETYARMRTALCALFSQHGGFGFANGVEWFAKEKIIVHESSSLSWGASDNQVAHLRRLHALLRNHPAFHDRTELKMVQAGPGNGVALLRHHRPSGKKLLILVNLDDTRQTVVHWQTPDMKGPLFTDLLTGERVAAEEKGDRRACQLSPGQVLCLTDDSSDLKLTEPVAGLPDRIVRQQRRAKALDVYSVCDGVRDMGDFDPDEAGRRLSEDPLGYCRSLNPCGDSPRTVTWQWPRDVRREVMVPPEHFILLRADRPFRARILNGECALGHEESLPCADGSYFALFSPLRTPHEHTPHILKLSVYHTDRCGHVEAPLLFLSRGEDAKVRKVFARSELLEKSLMFLGTNGRGGMLRANIDWGRLDSRYDALLAANISPDFPEDRRVMFTRCRAWVVFQGYSQEIRTDCLDAFRFSQDGRGIWRYHIPTGQGGDIFFNICMEMVPGENAVRISFFRHPNRGGYRYLADHKPVRLILRPDIEDRGFHETTKAYSGAEHHWPAAVTPAADAFDFAPGPDHRLRLEMPGGTFTPEPEWYYMVHRPLEAERGLDPDSDLFSPGYFAACLKGGEIVTLSARVLSAEDKTEERWCSPPLPDHFPLIGDSDDCEPEPALERAMAQFVVRRRHLSTVIAGYPWFLDWGRDTLIVVRGMIAAGKRDAARAILRQFARFEENGTLPNMIRGDDAGDRDTSDAPLWFFIACADLVSAEGNSAFLDEVCDGRTIREILVSMARSVMAGTPNGIRTDPESGLIFSPAHFTWMDTNYPAGTPREGYPIEIQAFWHFALSFMARTDYSENRTKWRELADQVRASVIRYFYIREKGYLADCLHTDPGKPARQAERDDALRPNQLFALTLDAVTEPDICRNVLAACETLLVPGAIRSLADQPVHPPLEIRHHGKLLNEPRHPYWGTYTGDEDTRRKPAYHNGTAWTWVFPSFCEAWVKCYGEDGRNAALAWLSSSTRLINAGCVGQMPEISDGDYPHIPRGCDAQAWGASEVFRVWKRIVSEKF